MPTANNTQEQTFWDHLDELRGVLLRIIVVVVVVAVVMFCVKEPLFDIILAPCSSDFPLFRWIGTEEFTVHLMNTGITEQLFTHMKVALYAGLLCASPYVLYQLFAYVSPALYQHERHYAVSIVGSAYVMFIVGTLVNYLLIFPFTLHFLATYQVSTDVDNMLTLQSYIDTLITMTLMMGVVFELPVVCRLLSMMGILHRDMMTQYRRQAFVAILIVAAVITPTTDVFTLAIVSLPIYLLYELSIPLVKKKAPKGIKS